MTYDEQTLMAECVRLAEKLICDDEVLNADAKTFQRHSAALAKDILWIAQNYRDSAPDAVERLPPTQTPVVPQGERPINGRLFTYLTHRDWCRVHISKDCNCGLEEALTAAEGLEGLTSATNQQAPQSSKELRAWPQGERDETLVARLREALDGVLPLEGQPLDPVDLVINAILPVIRQSPTEETP